MDKSISIKKATKLLKTMPLDAGHDLSHHERVRDLAFEILKQLPENLRNQVDKDTLEVAAMWHDVQIKKAERNKYLPGLAIKAIENHEFWDRPKTIEGKLLYDADKLDALSIERGRQIFKGIKRREISESRKQLYIRIGKFWLKHMRDRLHFDYSKQLYDKSLKELSINPEVEKLAEGIDIDIKTINSAIDSKPSIFEILIFRIMAMFKKRN
ncbi:hypothetical protein GF389_02660 [Candidatus Dojkabacteria bacterium]|nr:hypothetical protein [Candidatus Dojkabacteria bacterium]